MRFTNFSKNSALRNLSEYPNRTKTHVLKADFQRLLANMTHQHPQALLRFFTKLFNKISYSFLSLASPRTPSRRYERLSSDWCECFGAAQAFFSYRIQLQIQSPDKQCRLNTIHRILLRKIRRLWCTRVVSECSWWTKEHHPLKESQLLMINSVVVPLLTHWLEVTQSTTAGMMVYQVNEEHHKWGLPEAKFLPD